MDDRTVHDVAPLDASQRGDHIRNMSSPRPSRNLFFPLAVFCSVVFIMTILWLVASLFSDAQSPLAQWLDRHLGLLLTVEVVSILLTGFLALFVDRRQTLRSQPPTPQAPHDPQHPGRN